MIALEILSAAPGLSVQDVGRPGYRRFGVSVSGALDQRALALANALVGNPQGAAAVEIPLAGATFRAVGGPVLVAALGPGVVLDVEGNRVGARSLQVPEGVRITVGAPRGGVCGYLAVAGGIRRAPDLGSRSFHMRSCIGGPAIGAKTLLPCATLPPGAYEQALELDWRPPPGPIRFVSGPQEERFTPEALAAFRKDPFTVSPRSDRMGYRLWGPRLAHANGHDIVSEGVLPGSIQVPGDGQPIVLMRDCQTTGGYPKIGTVISADLDRLAQCPSGTVVRFTPVTREEAIAAAHAEATELARLIAAVRPASRSDGSTWLLSQNLIGGAVTGSDL
jgi:biotin-dependent carboxylase-like uncharacterized protein